MSGCCCFRYLSGLRMAEIERNFAQHPGKLKAFEDSQVQAEAEQDEKAKQLEKRIREIQEYFGYWIDPNDPRFEVMLKQKEAEEKKVPTCHITRLI